MPLLRSAIRIGHGTVEDADAVGAALIAFRVRLRTIRITETVRVAAEEVYVANLLVAAIHVERNTSDVTNAVLGT